MSKKLALGAMALTPSRSTVNERITAVRHRLHGKDPDEMTDEEVRQAVIDGKVHVPAAVEALRKSGRDALADELAQQVAVVEEPSAEEPSAEDETGSSDSSVSTPSVESSESVDSEEKFAVHDGAGWYSLSDSDEKMRGKKNVVEAGYKIVED